MSNNKHFFGSLKGFIISSLLENKSALKMTLFVTLGTVTVNFLVYVYFLLSTDSQSVFENEGALSIGFVTALITLVVVRFSSVSNREISRGFLFPINRTVYALGTFFSIIIIALAFLAGISAIAFLETLVGSLVEFINPQFVLTNQITLQNYGVGLWLSFSYLVFAISLTYLLAMYFYRCKLKSIIFISLLLIFLFTIARSIVFQMYSFIFLEQSVLVLSLKLWLLTLISHLLAYVPLKGREVFR